MTFKDDGAIGLQSWKLNCDAGCYQHVTSIPLAASLFLNVAASHSM